MNGDAVRGRFDPFRPLPAQVRRSHCELYLRFLQELDGDLDLEAHRLTGREGYFDELARINPDIPAGLSQANRPPAKTSTARVTPQPQPRDLRCRRPPGRREAWPDLWAAVLLASGVMG